MKKKRDHIKEVLVKDLPIDQFPHEYMKFIDPEWYNEKVFYVNFQITNIRATTAGMEINKLMNYRYVFKQLEIEFPWTDIREIWYNIQTILKRKYKKEMDMNFKSLESAVGGGTYSNKLYEHLGFEYWAYVYEYLKISPAEEITVYKPQDFEDIDEEEKEDDDNVFLLNKKTIKRLAKTPFFLIISEKKETLIAVMKDLYMRGYRKGYYGINLGKMATSYGIKLIIELSNIRNFHIFILHDLDISGLKIFLDMRKWVKRATIESIGVNTEFLEFADINFDEVCEEYKASNIEIKGVRRIIGELSVSEEQKEIYRKWSDSCLERKIELNSITAYRILEDITKPKARDYVDYLIQKIEEKKWNLTRVREFTRKVDYYDTVKGVYMRGIIAKPKLPFYYERIPEIVENIESEKHKIIKKESETFITELDNILLDIQEKYDDISKRLSNIKDTEDKNKDNKLDEFKEQNPELFDVDWRKLIEEKMGNSLEKMESIVKSVRKYYELKSLRSFLNRKIKLTKYEGSIKDIYRLERVISNEKKEWKKHDIKAYENKGFKRKRKLYKIIDRQVRKSEGYKTAKVKSDKLLKEFDEQTKDIKTDERIEVLEAFKEEMEQMFESLSNELDKLEAESD